MLRKAENVTLNHRVGFWKKTAPATLSVGQKNFRIGNMTGAEFDGLQDRQLHRPAAITVVGGRKYWQFRNRFYWEDEGLSSDQVHALLVTRDQRRQRQIENAQATVAMGNTPRTATVRKAVPDDVKQYIWARDEGRCRNCSAATELQFDHIIPLAKGGSNNADNLQVLCGPCNRAKSSGITIRR